MKTFTPAVKDPSWLETLRELGQLAWTVLLIDLIALGLGALAARSMGAFAYRVGLGITIFVTFCFIVLVGGNLVVVVLAQRWRTRHRSTSHDFRIQ